MQEHLNQLNLSKEEKLFSSHIQDCVTLCEKKNRMRFSGFLDLRMQKIAERTASGINSECFCFYGGFTEAERKMFGAFPDFIYDREEQFPISFICFSFSRSLSHRDFLGSLMSLGIKREVVGDILVGEDKCYIAVQSSFAEHIIDSLEKIGNVGVKGEICDKSDIVYFQSNFEENTVIVSSLRLDCIVAALAGKSRSDALKFIVSERVSLNHEVIISPSKQISEGDILSIRSVGKFKIGALISKTKKERLVLSYKKYI